MNRPVLKVIVTDGDRMVERMDELLRWEGGLAVTESGCPTSGPLFTLIHVTSGCAFASFRDHPSAVRAMRALRSTRVDWTASIYSLEDQLRHDQEARQVLIAIRNRSDIPGQQQPEAQR